MCPMKPVTIVHLSNVKSLIIIVIINNYYSMDTNQNEPVSCTHLSGSCEC